MIWSETPLKLSKYICYDLNNAYQERNPYLSWEVVKNPWIWKSYIEIQLCRWFYRISFANLAVITKQQTGSMRIEASPRSQLSGKMMKATQIRI